MEDVIQEDVAYGFSDRKENCSLSNLISSGLRPGSAVLLGNALGMIARTNVSSVCKAGLRPS